MVSPFLKLFGRSPFKLLHEHMSTVFECVKTLAPFFTAVLAENWEEAATLQEKITELENKADDLKRDLRLNLPKDLFLPVARTDLLELTSYQDYLANTAKDIAGLTLGRRMTFPPQIHGNIHHLLQSSIASAKQAYRTIRELNELLEAGFSGHEKEVIEKMLDTLHQIEHENDKIQITVYQTLYKLESTLPPVDVIFIYKIIEWLGQLADYAEKVGDRLQICISR